MSVEREKAGRKGQEKIDWTYGLFFSHTVCVCLSVCLLPFLLFTTLSGLFVLSYLLTLESKKALFAFLRFFRRRQSEQDQDREESSSFFLIPIFRHEERRRMRSYNSLTHFLSESGWLYAYGLYVASIFLSIPLHRTTMNSG